MPVPLSMPILQESCKVGTIVRANRFVTGPVSGIAEAGAGAEGIGVTVSSGAVGDYVNVTTSGRCPAIASAPIAANAYVQAASEGRFVTHTTGVVVGRARTAATGADTMFEVDLIKAQPLPA